MKAIAACGAIFDQADAVNVQLPDFMHSVGAGRLGVEAQNCSHSRQKRGIDAIGLGTQAHALGIVVQVPGVEHIDAQAKLVGQIGRQWYL